MQMSFFSRRRRGKAVKMAPKGIFKIKFFLPLQMIFWHLAQSAVLCNLNQCFLIRTTPGFYSPERHPNSALMLNWTVRISYCAFGPSGFC